VQKSRELGYALEFTEMVLKGWLDAMALSVGKSVTRNEEGQFILVDRT
jgi:hypothetical protein